MLGGRERVGAHEELILRARGDLDAGRLATAAVGLHAGLEAMIATGAVPDAADLPNRIAAARELSREALERALRGSDPDPEGLEVALRSAEAAMRRRALD